MATPTGTRKAQSNGHAASAQVEVRNPADNSIAGYVPDMGAADVAALAAQLREAQPAWEALGPKGRAKHLLAWLDWIMDNEERLFRIVQSETGKSWGDTTIETLIPLEVINYYAKHAEAFLRDESHRPHGVSAATKRLELYRRPYQLVGVITPWNYPLAMPMFDVPCALMAGAAVLSKPSEVTPLSWAACAEGWNEIGAPPVLGCATGLGGTGAAVVENVDMIQFTGSTKTGRKIAVAAAERLIPCSLELGGKDAMIVLDDADVDRAVGGAIWGGFFNAGQSCISVERVYVEDGVYDQFVDKLAEETRKLRVGMDAPGAFETEYGAMANENQMEIVERHVNDAIGKGARALTGGKRSGDGLFYEPTVLVDVDHSMSCMREETFGPTLPVMKVASEEEAVQLANDSPYGLAGSVWTKDLERARRIGRRMDTGGVCANNAMVGVFQLGMPMGGWKASGLGARFGGAYGLLKFTRQQTFVSERVALPSEPHWYPYKKRNAKLQARAVRVLFMHDWRRKLGLKPKR
jgi:acyl-CoA reductase-like NAD-dependent aldehyde dehydrogenase